MSEFGWSRERTNAPNTNSLIKFRSCLLPLTTTTTISCPFIFVRGCTWQILTNSISSRTKRRAKNLSFVCSTYFFTQNRFLVGYTIHRDQWDPLDFRLKIWTQALRTRTLKESDSKEDDRRNGDRSYCSSSVKEEKENVSRTRYYGSTSVDPKWKLRGGGGRELDSLSTVWRQRVEKRKSRRGRRLLRITVSKTDRPHLPPLLVPTLTQEY